MRHNGIAITQNEPLDFELAAYDEFAVRPTDDSGGLTGRGVA
jgi:hypothetical protein